MKVSKSFNSLLLIVMMFAPMLGIAQTVSSFTVVNADTGADIATFVGSGTVSITATPRINIRANASDVKSVVFTDGSTTKHTENSAPYAYKGNNGPVYFPWAPAVGTYVINATPFAGSGGKGAAGATAVLTLNIVTAGVNLPPKVFAGNDQTLPLPNGTTAILSGVASDADGLVVSYLWTQVAGPNPAQIGTPGSASTPLSGLVAGAYTFRLTVEDNNGNTAFDDVFIRVVSSQVGSGKLMIDPDSVHHFVYDRDNDGDGQRDPAYLAGVGGPEGFLYESASRKQTIINKLLNSSKINSPVNGIYFHAIRAFGGDGNSFETPFIDNANPRSGLDPQKIASWRADLKKLDDAGVILWFNLFDDHATPWGCKFNADYQQYAQDLVTEFKDFKHLIWVTQEEFRWPTQGNPSVPCAGADSDDRQRRLAAAIRSVDPVHPIATHHPGGSAMLFGDDPNIGVFGQQTGVRSPEAMHDQAGLKGWGDWVYVMAEDHSWHLDLIDAELRDGTGRALMRRSNWATALSGGYVLMYNSFECGNNAKLCNDGPTDSDPTDDMLDDLRRLKLFMESIPFNRLTPLFDNNGALTNAKTDGTKYILANPSTGQYLLYGDLNTSKLGVRNAPVGTYSLRWFDPVTGVTVNESGSVVAGGLASFAKPAGIGPEAVLYLRKQ